MDIITKNNKIERVYSYLNKNECNRLDQYRSVTGESRSSAIRRLLNTMLNPDYKFKRTQDEIQN